MQIYNTQTRKKEEFVPIEPGKVSIYACGPTVYNYIHIGNARPAVVFAENGQSQLVVKRESYADLVQNDLDYRA